MTVWKCLTLKELSDRPTCITLHSAILELNKTIRSPFYQLGCLS